MMKTLRMNFHVERKEISYLRWILESYDGMAFLKTIDPRQALIEIEISPGCEALVFELLDSLRKDEDIIITPAEPEEGDIPEGLEDDPLIVTRY